MDDYLERIWIKNGYLARLCRIMQDSGRFRQTHVRILQDNHSKLAGVAIESQTFKGVCIFIEKADHFHFLAIIFPCFAELFLSVLPLVF